MNIAILVPYLAKTGPVNVLLGLIDGIKNRAQIIVVTVYSDNDPDVVKEISSAGVGVHNLGNISIIKPIILRRLIKKYNVEVLNSHGLVPSIISRIVKDSVLKVVQTIHHNPINYFTHKAGKYIGSFVAWLEINCSNRSSATILVSKALLTEISGIKGSVYVVANGVVKNKYYYDEVSRIELRNNLGIKEEDIVFIYAGHLIEKKGVNKIISAFQVNNKSNCHILLIGDGLLYDDISKVALDVPNIHLLGRKSNVRDFYSAADYYISASESEGMPMAVLEAISCGCICFLSDIGPHRDIELKLGERYVKIISWKNFPVNVLSVNKKNIEIPFWVTSTRMADEYLSVLSDVLKNKIK